MEWAGAPSLAVAVFVARRGFRSAAERRELGNRSVKMVLLSFALNAP
jgi:hypothetical protein